MKQAKSSATATPTAETPVPVTRNAIPTAAQVAHILEVRKLLAPQEAAVARATAAKLSPQDHTELLAELETIIVQQAAAFVRSMLPTMN